MTAAPVVRRLRVRGPVESLLQRGLAFTLLFTVVHGVIAATTTGLGPIEAAELVLICGAQVLLGDSLRRAPAGRGTLALVAVMIVAATALACAHTRLVDPRPDYSAWQYGAISIVLLSALVLGRYAYVAGVMAAVVVITVACSVWAGQGVWAGVAIVDRHVATLFVGGCFSVGYRRTLDAGRRFRELAGQQRALEIAAQARAGARRAAAEVVLEQAGPMLAALAEGRLLSRADRRELVVIEGALRDRMRAGRLLSGPLPDAIADARRRGVDVLLVDETEPPVTDAHRAAASWLAERLDGTGSGRFVGRLRSEPGRLTASAGSGATSETAAFGA